MIRKKKRYGFDRTALRLSAKAEAMYTAADPLNIWEYTVNGLNLYDITGCIEAQALTEAGVNEYLEGCYDELAA